MSFRSIAGFGVKLCISVGILYLVFSRIDLPRIGEVFLTTGWRRIGLIAIAGLGVWYVEYQRFVTALLPIIDRDKEMPLWRVFFSGYALRFVIPGGHGELGKMLFVGGRYLQRVLAYIIDKGSLAFAVLFAGLISAWKIYPQYRSHYWVVLLVAPILVLLIWIIYRKFHSKFSVIAKYPFKAILPVTIPLSLLHVLLMALQYWLILHNFDVSFWTLFGTVSIIMIALMLPISLAGLGVREWISLQILVQFDVTREAALLAPLLVFFWNVLLPALIGVGTMLLFNMKLRLREKMPDYSNSSDAMEK